MPYSLDRTRKGGGVMIFVRVKSPSQPLTKVYF